MQCSGKKDTVTAAVLYYERAIALGLETDDLRGAYLGLGSTLRALGEYEKAEATLLAGVEHFPLSGALRVFLAMALYNRAHYHEAMELLLGELTRPRPDPEIAAYRRAIALYAEDLDRRWS